MQQQISGEKQRRDPAAVASSLFANFKQQHNNLRNSLCGLHSPEEDSVFVRNTTIDKMELDS